MTEASTAGRHGPPSPRIVHLKRPVRRKLEGMVRAGTTENRLATRARIILLRAEGTAIMGVARHLGVSQEMVHLWCDRFRRKGIKGLRDLPRSGRPRKLSLETSELPL
jgi:Helix-turn-helix domain